MSQKFSTPHRRPSPRAGFTLIELMVVMGVIVLLVALAVPAVRSLSKSNDQSQSANVVRALISSARSIAISRHTMAGVVFFEEDAKDGTGKYFSLPRNANQTAMQIIVEDYNQQQYQPLANPQLTIFVPHSSTRQYLPAGVKVAVLSDQNGGNSLNIETGAVAGAGANAPAPARVVLFDANGELVTRAFVASPSPGDAFPGTYPRNVGDWRLLTPAGVLAHSGGNGNAFSSPGFFLYNKAEFDTLPNNGPADKIRQAQWLKDNANVIIINSNTGTIFQ